MSGSEVFKAGVQLAEKVVIGQHVDGLAQPLNLTLRDDISNMSPVRQYCHGLPAFRALDSTLPRPGLLARGVQVVGRDRERLLAHGPKSTAAGSVRPG
jgi:hypothetical protein